MSVGLDHDTPVFAVTSIEAWWRQVGSKRYPDARELYITADAGGSNSYRAHVWEFELQRLADKLDKAIHVSHFPPGTSKWNKVEHRLFSFISMNWRGRPLRTYETVVNLISNTTNLGGLVESTMKTLLLTRFAKACISWHPRPAVGFDAEGLLTRDTLASELQSPKGFLSVEALVPRGARADYGMLGVAYDPDRAGQLHVTVGYCKPQGERWQQSLAASIDDVRVGLAKEYSEAVLEGLLAGLLQPPSGSLTIKEAAHGLVGSSSAFFQKLARAAGELVFLDQPQMADDSLAERLRTLLAG